MAIKAKEEEFIEKYRVANPKERFGIMINNYAVFPKMIRKAEKKIRYMIIMEREYLRSKARGELGVRVQGSGPSDMTADDAIMNSYLDDALMTGEITRGLLKGLENACRYELDIRTLAIMRMDYDLLKEVVEGLDEKDLHIMTKYLLEGKYIKEIADEEGRTPDAIKKRIRKIRFGLCEEMLECLEMNNRKGKKK